MANSARKLRDFVPSHYYDELKPLLEAVGTGADTLNESRTEFWQETFLLHAPTEILDEIGRAWNIPRFEGESDTSYRLRIRSLKYNVTKENIRQAVLGIEGVEEVEIRDDFTGHFDAEADLSFPEFGNRGPLGLQNVKGCFSVLVTPEAAMPVDPNDPTGPQHTAHSFLGDFLGMTFISGTITPSSTGGSVVSLNENDLLALIQQKAPAGSGYRLLIKGATDKNVGNLQNQSNELNIGVFN